MAMPEMIRWLKGTSSLWMTQLEKTMFSNPLRVSVPIFSPLQQPVTVQCVTVTLRVTVGSPKGFSLLRQMASSAVAISQSEMFTFWQQAMSMPSTLGP